MNPRSARRICAVIPAAGRGSRLGSDAPKVFLSLRAGLTLWDVLHEKLATRVEKIVLVLSPAGRDFLEEHRGEFDPSRFTKVTVAVQTEPRGMGAAIFGAAADWREYDDLLVVWGDQFNLSTETIARAINLHLAEPGPALTLPLVRMPQPYVEYVFDPAGSLTSVRQSREGDACSPYGFSDVGTFLLSAGRDLETKWNRYLGAPVDGAVTSEINFLPFLAYLSHTATWPVRRCEVADPAEAIGINTPEDLAFARRLREKGTA